MIGEYVLRREQWIPKPPETVFAFFSDAGNLAQITPAWLHFEVLTPRPIAMASGALLDYQMRWHGIPIDWTTEIGLWEPPLLFTDSQLLGPYRSWHHTHSFAPHDGGTRMLDEVVYSLPLGMLGWVAHALVVRRNLEQIFDYRDRRIGELFGGASGVR